MSTAFEVTDADLALLDPETFDHVWYALGLVVRARHPWHEPDAPAAPPELVLRVEPVGLICPECGETKANGAGLSSHRRVRHGVFGKGKALPEAQRPLTAAERIAASRKRGAERAGFVNGHTGQETRCWRMAPSRRPRPSGSERGAG